MPNSVPFPSSEQCLSMDLYVPPGASAARPLPVMVYLYGGAFLLGSTWQYDSPVDLVRRGKVIVAVPNYRVGPLGFLSLPELAARNGGVSGTLGILDQQFALKWLQKNVARFGGDPRNVTLFGESAGGMSVCLQVASPGSRGLFSRAIVQSGACARSPLVPPAREVGYQRSIKYAASLGCTNPRTRLTCLRRLPVDRLLDSPTTKFDSAVATWTPFKDGVVVADTPEDALRNGAARGMPLIVGSNSEEGSTFVALFDYMKARIPTDASYRTMVHDLYGADAAKVLAMYPSSRYSSPANAAATVYTDSIFACSAQATLEAAAAGGARVWQYQFEEAPFGRSQPLLPGAFHASELPYLFSRLGGVPLPWTGASTKLADQMQKQWATFATTSTPTASGLPAWSTWTPSRQQFLSITAQRAKMAGGFTRVHQCDFWSSLS